MNIFFDCGIVTDTCIMLFVMRGIGKSAGRSVSMKKTVYSRLLCILIMVSMLVPGIYCEDIHSDSSFSSVFDDSHTSFLQAADHIADTHIYHEESSLRLIETFVLTRQSARTSTILRISQYMILLLLMTSVYLLSISIQNSDLFTGGYRNQYSRRTLEYIHRNDGKKSHTC